MALTQNLRQVRAKLAGAGIRLGFDCVLGDAADTNIPVVGIRTKDQLMAVLNIADAEDITATSSITSDGNIQNSGDTTGDPLVIVWLAMP